MYTAPHFLVIAAGWGLLGPVVLARYGNRTFVALTLCLVATAHSVYEIPLLSLGAPASMLVENLLPTSLPEFFGLIVVTLEYGFPFWASSLAAYLVKRSGRPIRVQCFVGATVAVMASLITPWLVFPGAIWIVGGLYLVVAFWLAGRSSDAGN